jgi:hypothetical protein
MTRVEVGSIHDKIMIARTIFNGKLAPCSLQMSIFFQEPNQAHVIRIFVVQTFNGST